LDSFNLFSIIKEIKRDMKKIPTSEEILVKNSVFENPEISNFNLIIHRDGYITAQKNIKRAMIEFAKMHVEAALRKASDRFDHCLIPNSYPLDNIK